MRRFINTLEKKKAPVETLQKERSQQQEFEENNEENPQQGSEVGNNNTYQNPEFKSITPIVSSHNGKDIYVISTPILPTDGNLIISNPTNFSPTIYDVQQYSDGNISNSLPPQLQTTTVGRGGRGGIWNSTLSTTDSRPSSVCSFSYNPFYPLYPEVNPR
jgi:hypothetical protein